MKLIVGLGNPGQQYANTPHNVGFDAVDQLASQLEAPSFTAKYKGLITQIRAFGETVLILKPQTFMNVSGESVQAAMSFYKLEHDDLIVVSDDLDLPLGKLRYRTKGGHGGHNGIRNIIQLTGSGDFHRLRIGIGRPNGKASVSSYVLSKPNEEMKVILGDAIDDACSHLKDFIKGNAVQIAGSK